MRKFFYLFLISTGSSFCQTLDDDKAALIALYNATDGPNWNNKTNWITNPDVSTWFGVTVIGDRVKILNLITNNLSGTLPEELGNLTGLVVLAISNNNLTGDIPSALGNLENLGSLSLRSNGLFSGPGLTGSLPATLGSLTTLTQLDVAENDLSGGIPASLGNLTGLENLDLGGNNFSGEIPSSFFGLTNLETLTLDRNNLDGTLSPDFGELTKLRRLSVGVNSFQGNIPPEIGLLNNLEYLALHHNQFTGQIPNELGQLNKLTELFLLDNQLTGSIPAEIGNLSNLEIFNARNNLLEGSLPSEIGELDKLNFLILSGNLLNGFPDLSESRIALSGLLAGFRVSDNRLTFEDLEPNISIITENTGQKPFGALSSVEIEKGKDKEIEFIIGGTQNSYQWEKGGVEIQGANSKTLKIIGAVATDAGVYTLKVTNAIVTGLTLMSQPITVTIIESIPVPKPEPEPDPDPVTAVDDKVQFDFGIYPNPATDKLLVPIGLHQARDFEINILDQKGNNILVNTSYTDNGAGVVELNVSDLSPGVYTVIVQSQLKTKAMRFVKK